MVTFYLKRQEPVEYGARRIATELMTSAIRLLLDSDVDPVVAIHELRKHCKMMRGLLRLIRTASPSMYRTENARFRDLAQRFSGDRDDDVAWELLRRLADPSQDRRVRQAAAEAQAMLEQRRARASHRGTVKWEQAVDELLSAIESIASWPLDGLQPQDAVTGFRRIYSRGRHQLKRLDASADVHAVHEFRKSVKYHWYHVRLLKRVAPKKIRRREKLLDALGERLGYHHDLAILQARLSDASGACSATRDAESDAERWKPLLEYVRLEQARVLSDLLPLAHRLYAPKPGSLAKKLRGSWISSWPH